MQRARRCGSVESAECSTRETIKFFRQTGRRRGRSHSGSSGSKKSKGIFAGETRSRPVQTLRETSSLLLGGTKGLPSPDAERGGDVGARAALEPGCRLSEVRGSESQSRRGVGLQPRCPRLPFLLPEPRMEGREGMGAGVGGGGGATSMNRQRAVLGLAEDICSLASSAGRWPSGRWHCPAHLRTPTPCPVLMIPGNKAILTVSWGWGHVEFQGWELTSGPTLWALTATLILPSSPGERPRLPAGGVLTTFSSLLLCRLLKSSPPLASPSSFSLQLTHRAHGGQIPL